MPALCARCTNEVRFAAEPLAHLSLPARAPSKPSAALRVESQSVKSVIKISFQKHARKYFFKNPSRHVVAHCAGHVRVLYQQSALRSRAAHASESSSARTEQAQRGTTCRKPIRRVRRKNFILKNMLESIFFLNSIATRRIALCRPCARAVPTKFASQLSRSRV